MWRVGSVREGARFSPTGLLQVKEIDDLDRAGKMQIGQIPDPFGSITHDNFLWCAAPATVPGFQIGQDPPEALA